MIELLRRLFQAKSALPDLDPLLRELIHSDLLTEYVRASSSPADDIVLRVLRALIPRDKN